MQITDEQQAITSFAKGGKGSLIIEALAGSGKTFTLLEALKVLPQQSILMVAFNKKIADELNQRRPKMPKTHVVHVQTFHALGLSVLRHRHPHLAVDKDATEDLVKDAIGSHRAGFDVRRAATRVLRAAKEALTVEPRVIPDLDDFLEVGWNLNLFGKLRDSQIEEACSISQRAFSLGADMLDRKTIDFCDMVWAPLWFDMPPKSRYQAIIVDELQDISPPQLQLIRKLCLPTTRIIAAGDTWQQIYSWRGSMGTAAWTSIEGATRLPLTITWRCPITVVKEAQTLVPTLRARPDADEGSVARCTLGQLPLKIPQGHSDSTHTFVLSRNNAALLDCALFLWREKTAFQLNAGQELLEPIFNLLDYVLDMRSEDQFRKSLLDWHKKEVEKGTAANAVAWVERVTEQKDMLLAALRYAKPTHIKGLLQAILAPNKAGVLLSTVHKVKGLEADNVFLLKQTFARHDGRARDPEDEIPQEELNIEYVAITRSKQRLIWVDLDDRTVGSSKLISEMSDDELGAEFELAERQGARALAAGEDASGHFAAARAISEEIARRGRMPTTAEIAAVRGFSEGVTIKHLTSAEVEIIDNAIAKAKRPK